MSDSVLDYISPAPSKPRRLRALSFTLLSVPFLVFSFSAFIYSVELLKGDMTPTKLTVPSQVLVNIFIFFICAAAGGAMFNRSDPQRARISNSLERPPYSQLAVISLWLAITGIITAFFVWPCQYVFMRFNFDHGVVALQLAERLCLAIFALIPLSAFFVGVVDIWLAFFRKHPRRGYRCSLGVYVSPWAGSSSWEH